MGFLLLTSGPVALPAQVVEARSPFAPNYAVTLTAYNAVPAQTDSDPLVTASGLYSNPEVIAARSQDLKDELPFGTIIEMDAPAPQHTCGYDIVRPIIGYRVIADSMNVRYTERIDVLFSMEDNYTMPSGKVKNAGTVLGICNDVTIRVVGRLDLSKDRVPKTQTELAAIVLAGTHKFALK